VRRVRYVLCMATIELHFPALPDDPALLALFAAWLQSQARLYAGHQVRRAKVAVVLAPSDDAAVAALPPGLVLAVVGVSLGVCVQTPRDRLMLGRRLRAAGWAPRRTRAGTRWKDCWHPAG